MLVPMALADINSCPVIIAGHELMSARTDYCNELRTMQLEYCARGVDAILCQAATAQVHQLHWLLVTLWLSLGYG